MRPLDISKRFRAPPKQISAFFPTSFLLFLLKLKIKNNRKKLYLDLDPTATPTIETRAVVHRRHPPPERSTKLKGQSP